MDNINGGNSFNLKLLKDIQRNISDINSIRSILSGIRAKGFSNKRIIKIKVPNQNNRYGIILLISMHHACKISVGGPDFVIENLYSNNNIPNVEINDEGTIIITMHNQFEHGFVIIGGSIANYNIEVE